MKKIGAKFVPTEIGMVVTELLVKNFPYIFEAGYTAKLEGELDAVEAGPGTLDGSARRVLRAS